MKVAWFRGDCRSTQPYQPYRSMDEIMAGSSEFEGDHLELVLVPDDANLEGIYGDDWNDAPADCNAGPPYERTLPPGSKVLRLRIGDTL